MTAIVLVIQWVRRTPLEVLRARSPTYVSSDGKLKIGVLAVWDVGILVELCRYKTITVFLLGC